MAEKNKTVRTINGADSVYIVGTDQTFIASFIEDGWKEPKSAKDFKASPAPLNVNLGGMTGANSPPSCGTYSESSGGKAVP
ncbi:hypothetical protein FXO37_01953 [Capsicum annuum]|nr:hypothetical protein FXO37_01953 [Capsicum annuum]